MTTATTTDALPDLKSDYPVTPALVEQYRETGHVLLRAVASPEEVTAYQPVIRAAADRFNTETRALEERDTYGKAFLQIMNLWTRDEGVRRFTQARRFAKIAADLMGVEGVRIYHDQALFKEPGGGPTPWHQDQHYWPLDTEHTITLWMPLVNIPAQVGSMVFGSGSHSLGYVGDLGISDRSDAVLAEFIRERGLEKRSYGAMAAGDATFHAGWTLHSAPGNPTEAMREVMTIIYFADGTRVADPQNKNQESDLRGWLPGLVPGDRAGTKLNPLVYSRHEA